MADLSAEDADWIPISPIEPRKGREAIRQGYLQQVEHTNRPIINDRYYAEGDTCVVEFEIALRSDRVAAIVDVFTINDEGEIARLGRLPTLIVAWPGKVPFAVRSGRHGGRPSWSGFRRGTRAQTTGRWRALPWVAMLSEQIAGVFDDHETIASRCPALSPAVLRACEAGR